MLILVAKCWVQLSLVVGSELSMVAMVSICLGFSVCSEVVNRNVELILVENVISSLGHAWRLLRSLPMGLVPVCMIRTHAMQRGRSSSWRFGFYVFRLMTRVSVCLGRLAVRRRRALIRLIFGLLILVRRSGAW